MPVSRVDHGTEAALDAAATAHRPDDPATIIRDEIERHVQARTQALSQRNQDLDAFARQLAHELRTPLAHLSGLNELLKRSLRPALDPTTAELLRLQRQATTHMTHLVDDLLAMARADIEPLDDARIDLPALARELVAEMPDVAGRAAPVDWRFEPLPAARGAPTLLRLLLVNLLSNAAKYTRDTPAPVVRLDGTLGSDGRLHLRLQDNGVGFDPQRAVEIFRPFVRLHGDSHAEGVGVGLSTVLRVVERHGGQIRAEGRPGLGASFHFDLPAESA